MIEPSAKIPPEPKPMKKYQDVSNPTIDSEFMFPFELSVTKRAETLVRRRLYPYSLIRPTLSARCPNKRWPARVPHKVTVCIFDLWRLESSSVLQYT
jgi:hypothetical protein